MDEVEFFVFGDMMEGEKEFCGDCIIIYGLELGLVGVFY